MTDRQTAELKRIIAAIRKLSEYLMAEGMPNYSLTLQSYAAELQKVIE